MSEQGQTKLNLGKKNLFLMEPQGGTSTAIVPNKNNTIEIESIIIIIIVVDI